MPIKWSALKVSEAADMIEEYFNQAVEPLEQIKVVAQEAKHIPNLPEYISQYLIRIEGEVERCQLPPSMIHPSPQTLTHPVK